MPTSNVEPLVVDIPTTGELLGGISRTQVYRLISSGRLHSVTLGRRRLVPMSAIRSLIDDDGPEAA